MSESESKPKPEEKFLVPRRWDELDLSEKIKIDQERKGFGGMSAADKANAEKMMKLSRKHYLGE